MLENLDNLLGYEGNIPEDIKSIENIEDDKNTTAGYKKTSVGLPPDLLPFLDASPMNQTQTIVAALRFYFSDAHNKLIEYQNTLSGYENKIREYEDNTRGYEGKIKEYEDKTRGYEGKITEYDKEIAVLKAQIKELLFIKQEYTRLHELIDELKDISKAHMAQVQTLIEERKKQDYLLQQKDEKMLQLEEANNQKEAELKEKSQKKRKWKFWKKE
jgi:chromosome segregation ATPase